MIAQKNASRKDASRRYALVQLPSLIIIAGFILIVIALYFMLVVSHQEAQALAMFLSLLGVVMVFSGSIVLLVSTPSLFKSTKQFGYIDKETSIKVERAGNVFFWIIYSITVIIGIIGCVMVGYISAGIIGIPVFLLILRRAYIRDRLRKIKAKKY